MKTGQKRLFLMLGTSVSTLLGAWAAPAAMAQEAASADEDVDVVVITAQKREQDVLDVGVLTAAISQQDLSELRIEQIRDLGRSIPNFSVKEQIPGAIPVVTSQEGSVFTDTVAEKS